VNSRAQIPVAVFLTAFEPGGTERQMIELIRRLDPERYRVHVACFRRAGAWMPNAVERAASVVEFPIRGFSRPSTLLQWLRFARWCRRERIALIQTCDFYANVFGLPGAFAGGVPVRIGSRRELITDKSPRQIALQRWAYRFATRVVANSPAALQLLEAEGVPASKLATISNGVDAEAWPARASGDAITRVITVANLRPEKNHETLIAAAAALASTHPQLRFQIVGDGARRAALEHLAELRGVAHMVEFLGHREDVPALLAGADLFVLPSRTEAFPNSAIEAMAAGLPVVCSAVGGLLDLVTPGRTGLLVDPSDPEALAAAIRSLADDPARARALGAAARAEVRSRYSFDRMVQAFEELYEAGLRDTRTQARVTNVPVSERKRVEGTSI
jgi:glycosyltransferase involved in cell wall biosynthesis